jgi:hypothetical protein
MKKIFLAFFLCSNLAFADSNNQTPLYYELLPNPINLSNYCSNSSIIEWRGSQISKDAIDIINYYCNLTIDNFYKFTLDRGYNLEKVSFNYNYSLMVWNPEKGGKEYRNLNDTKFRFSSRPGYCDPLGNEITYTGQCSNGQSPAPVDAWINYELKIIFMRNDPLINNSVNLIFAEVLVHETFHGLSKLTGLRNRLTIIQEEKLAREFTIKLGLGST